MYFTRQLAKRLKVNNDIRNVLEATGVVPSWQRRLVADLGEFYDPVDDVEGFDREADDVFEEELIEFTKSKRRMWYEMNFDALKLKLLHPLMFHGNEGRYTDVTYLETECSRLKLSWIYGCLKRDPLGTTNQIAHVFKK